MSNPAIIAQNDSPAVTPATDAELSNFEVAYLMPNGARVLSIGFVYVGISGTLGPAWYQDLGNTDVQDVYNFNNWKNDAGLYRPAYKSITTYLNATAFNDTGACVAASFNPSILFGGTLTELSIQHPDLFKGYVRYMHSVSKLTLTRDHPSYADGHNIFASLSIQSQHDIKRITSDSNPSIGIDPNTNIQILNLNSITETAGGGSRASIPTMSQILNLSQRSYGGRAREGMFAVQKLNTATPRWHASTNIIPTDSFLPGLYECWYGFVDSTGDRQVVPFYEPAPPGTLRANFQHLRDTLWSMDFTFTWLRFEGLTFNPSQTSKQLMIRKYYTGFEVQPAYASAWAGMQKTGPVPDLTAMQAVMDGFYNLKDAMPAKYNFLGTLLPMIGNGLMTFGSKLLSDLIAKKTENMTPAAVPQPLPQRQRRQRNQVSNPQKERGEIANINKTVQALASEIKAMRIHEGIPRNLPNRRPRRRRVAPRLRVPNNSPAPVQPLIVPSRNRLNRKRALPRNNNPITQ
jgi:hypothetical protein